MVGRILGLRPEYPPGTSVPTLGLHQVFLCIVGTLVAVAVIVARSRTFLEPRRFALGVVGIVLSINNISLDHEGDYTGYHKSLAERGVKEAADQVQLAGAGY
jgi:hypothetical protein